MRNKKNILLGLMLASTLVCRAEVGKFQITFKVIDESGNPVAGVNVGASYIQSQSLAPITANNLSKKQAYAVTDKDGQAVITDSSVYNNYIYSSIKPVTGYYPDGSKEYRFEHVENGKWRPWNPTITFILKPIGVRVPMYAKKIWFPALTLPENNKSIGFDLELGDWVAPYGKGITPDFLFTLERKFTSVTQDFNATLTITFPNDGDGIQSVMSDSSCSVLRVPSLAPENGYESKLILQMYREKNKPIVGALADPSQNYFFRVRTKMDDRGNIVSALYGKIQGGIGWDIFHSPTAQIQFMYYLNSKLNSRNMEFDPQQNLFENLPPLERATAP